MFYTYKLQNGDTVYRYGEYEVLVKCGEPEEAHKEAIEQFKKAPAFDFSHLCKVNKARFNK